MTEVKCFHGTSRSRASNIKKIGFNIKQLDIHNKEPEYMPGDIGAGLYAFIKKTPCENARRFAYKKHKKNTVVIEFSFEKTDELFILNLDEPEWSNKLSEFRNTLNLGRIEKRARKDKGKRHVTLDGYVIEFFINEIEKCIDKNYKSLSKEVNRKVDVVVAESYTKFETTGGFQSSKIPNGVEVCIRNGEIIKNITTLDNCNEEEDSYVNNEPRYEKSNFRFIAFR